MDKNVIKDVVSAERQVMLQGMLDYYLRVEKNTSYNKMFPNEPDIYGKLTDGQVKLLHDVLAFEYKQWGLDLNAVLAQKGEQPDESGLTKFEIDELLRIVDREIGVMGTVMKRKKILFRERDKEE